MRIYAIGDLHLPGGQQKPMDVFGLHWENHFERIRADWLERVDPQDLVLLPGDFSWAMTMQEVQPDLENLSALPGRKVLLRGNHDFWWSSLTRVRAALGAGCFALQNDALDFEDCIVAGTRGWTIVSENSENSQEKKVFEREKIRLELSLQAANKKAEGRPIVCMMHFPPLGEKQSDTPFSELMKKYGVSVCVYGHLHGAGIHAGFEGEKDGIVYHLVSCDALDFHLKEIRLPFDKKGALSMM